MALLSAQILKADITGQETTSIYLQGGDGEEALMGKLSDGLQQQLKLKAEDEIVRVLIRVNVADLGGVKKDKVVDVLKKHASRTQEPVLKFLEEENATILNTFWLGNDILANVTVNTLYKLSSLPMVERIYEDSQITISGNVESSPSDPPTWGLNRIGAPDVWAIGIDGSGVRVAVLDTGVDITHPDLAGKMWTDNPADTTYPGGWIEFDSNGNVVVGSVPYDSDISSAADPEVGHGTHNSGIVLGGNASGTAIGVAPGARLMHALVTPDRSGTVAQVRAGMQWATDGGADVVNMSLGGLGYIDSIIVPIREMKAAGVVPVVAIGNDGEGTSWSPGNVYESFAVGATNSDDSVRNLSGGEVVYKTEWTSPPTDWPNEWIVPDFSAPGGNVYSSLPGNNYDYKDGTSFAAPHVAGTVALMLQANPNMTVDEVYEILRVTADDLGDQGKDNRYGWGVINAYDAVVEAPKVEVTLSSSIIGLPSGTVVRLGETFEVIWNVTNLSTYTTATNVLVQSYVIPITYTVCGYDSNRTYISLAPGETKQLTQRIKIKTGLPPSRDTVLVVEARYAGVSYYDSRGIAVIESSTLVSEIIEVNGIPARLAPPVEVSLGQTFTVKWKVANNFPYRVENVAAYSYVYLYEWQTDTLTRYNVGGWLANREFIDLEAGETKELVQTITIRTDVEPSTETRLRVRAMYENVGYDDTRDIIVVGPAPLMSEIIDAPQEAYLGDTFTVTWRVTNNLSTPAEDFGAYSYVYLYVPGGYPISYNVGGWVANREFISLQPGETRTLTQSITIRDDLEPSQETKLRVRAKYDYVNYDDTWIIIILRPVEATVHIDPDELDLASQGSWVTAYIELPEGHNVENIGIGTVVLRKHLSTVTAEAWPWEIGDYDGDGVPDLMVKFDRSAVIDLLEPGLNELRVTGRVDDVGFAGSAFITAIYG